MNLFAKADLIAVLLNASNPFFENQLKDVNEAARALGLKLHIETASNEREITAAFPTARRLGIVCTGTGSGGKGARDRSRLHRSARPGSGKERDA
jgi:hypothetical protein